MLHLTPQPRHGNVSSRDVAQLLCIAVLHTVSASSCARLLERNTQLARLSCQLVLIKHTLLQMLHLPGLAGLPTCPADNLVQVGTSVVHFNTTHSPAMHLLAAPMRAFEFEHGNIKGRFPKVHQEVKTHNTA